MDTEFALLEIRDITDGILESVRAQNLANAEVLSKSLCTKATSLRAHLKGALAAGVYARENLRD